MTRISFLATFFAAVASLFLFSGQAGRPYAQPQQRQPAQVQQRQSVQQRSATPTQQRQTTPPVSQQAAPSKPATTTASNPTPPTIPAISAMEAKYLLPEDIQFPETQPGASPTITLFGDPRSSGLYVTRTLIPHGTKTIPHIHADSRTVTVLSGVCHYGHGVEFDEKMVIPMPSGSFFTEPAGTPHYIWAKDGDVVVQTTAVGPSSTQFAPVNGVKDGKKP